MKKVVRFKHNRISLKELLAKVHMLPSSQSFHLGTFSHKIGEKSSTFFYGTKFLDVFLNYDLELLNEPEGDFEVVLNTSQIAKALDMIKENEVEFALKAKNVELKTESSTYKFNYIKVDAVPDASITDNKAKGEALMVTQFPDTSLVDVLSSCKPFVPREKYRTQFANVVITNFGTDLLGYATNGFSLGAKVICRKYPEDTNITINHKYCEMIAKLFKGKKDLTINSYSNCIEVTDGQFTVNLARTEDQTLSVNGFIPNSLGGTMDTSPMGSFLIVKSDILPLVQNCIAFSEDADNKKIYCQIDIHLEDNKATFFASNDNGEITSTLPIMKNTFGNTNFTLNIDLLVTCLKSIDSDVIKVTNVGQGEHCNMVLLEPYSKDKDKPDSAFTLSVINT